jgi:hypothetical protein
MVPIATKKVLTSIIRGDNIARRLETSEDTDLEN